MHFTFARRAAYLTAVPALFVTLTACNSAVGTTETVSGTAAPVGIASGTAGPTPAAASPTEAVVPAGWRGTTQFAQIKAAGTAGGTQYLEIRHARQKPQGKGFETVALKEPWIKAELSPRAQNVPLRGKSGDADQLSAALAERTAGERDEGFEVTFDGTGKISKVTWLYASVREQTQAALGKWAGSTQFLQIRDARERDGVTYLRVRPAEKEYLGESFETRTIGGPWIEVVMSALAENVPLRGVPGDAGALRADLADRLKSQVEEGFDISFSSNGQVSKVTWLYPPAG